MCTKFAFCETVINFREKSEAYLTVTVQSSEVIMYLVAGADVHFM